MRERHETKILTSWQKDENHDEPYDLEITIFKSDIEKEQVPLKYSSSFEEKYKDEVEVEVVEKEEEKYQICLPPLLQAVFLSIIDEARNLIKIFTLALDERIRPSWNILFEYKTPFQRFSKDNNTHDYEPIMDTAMQKLIKDCLFYSNILKAASAEIRDAGTFECARNVIEKFWQHEYEEYKIIFKYVSNKDYIQQLCHLLHNENKDAIIALEEKDQEIHKAKMDLESAIFYSRAELKYVNKYENTCTYLNTLNLSNNQKKYQDIIEWCKTSTERENEIHKQIESYIVETKEDNLKDIEHWIRKYDVDTENIDNEILKLKIEREDLFNERVALSGVYESRKQQIEEYLAYKEAKRVARNLFILQMQAATKIQRWWIRIMQRRNLGPYKKLNEKGKAKEKGAKGGKKKK